MKLSGKTMLVLAGVIAASVALNFSILQTQVYPSFVALENGKADQNMDRVRDTLSAEFRSLSTTTADWAHWTDTFDYAAGKETTYVDDNLYLATNEGLGVNFMYIFNSSGELLYENLFDLDTGEALATDGFLLSNLPGSHLLLQHSHADSVHQGLVLTSYGPALLASRPILNNEKELPSAGSFIIGRFLNEAEVAALHDQTHVDFQVWPIGESAVPDSEQAYLTRLLDSPDDIIRELGQETVATYAVLNDVMGQPALLLRADTPRDITAIGAASVNYALILMLTVGMAVMVAMWFLLKMVVIGPLGHLTGQVLSIAKDKDNSRRLSMERDDEIGTLAQEFDRMLDELLRKEGMAVLGQITATVSHELRNPLGAMRNSVFAITEKTRNKGLEVESALERVDRNIQRCDGIITDLMNFAEDRTPDMIPMAFDPWLEKTIAAHTPPAGITISNDLAASSAEVNIDAELLGCAVDNLIENACQAMADAQGGAGDAEITVTSKIAGERVEITVTDQGPGIPAEVLPKIFEPLFSTKGFGVGVGLPIVKRILERHGGGVSITSETGKGTVAQLWLPLHQAQQAAA